MSLDNPALIVAMLFAAAFFALCGWGFAPARGERVGAGVWFALALSIGGPLALVCIPPRHDWTQLCTLGAFGVSYLCTILVRHARSAR